MKFKSLFISAALSLGAAQAVTTYPNTHMSVANNLIQQVGPANNYYGSPSVITWPGEGSVDVQSVCAPFVSLLLQKTYGAQGIDKDFFKAVFNSTSPFPASYVEAIDAQRAFENWSLKKVTQISQMKVGDIIAIDYMGNACSNGVPPSVTGHVLLVDSTPALKSYDSKTGQYTYTLSIVDATSSRHGDNDSREVGETGVGRGSFTLLGDRSGKVIGYRWSATSPVSATCYQNQRYLTVGRLAKQ